MKESDRSFGILIDRYESLRLKESLGKSSLYVPACKELSFILKNHYSNFPKTLQALIFEDVRFAFIVLPELATQTAISAAKSLLRSAEFALPKQKRALAVKEHKQAVVASKRKSKANYDGEGMNLLPQDVLVHIFSFLDAESVVAASTVCRSWCIAACDTHLWEHLYAACFGKINNVTKKLGRQTSITATDSKTDWKALYSTTRKVMGGKVESKRGYCHSCSSIIWLSSSDCLDKHSHQIRAISTAQVCWFLLGDDDDLDSDCSSDSDSDTDDTSFRSLWNYPTHF